MDGYISTVTRRLRDPAPVVRSQSLIIITQLLQEDFIKWKASRKKSITVSNNGIGGREGGESRHGQDGSGGQEEEK